MITRDFDTAEKQSREALNASALAVLRAPGSAEAKQEYEQAQRQLNEALRAKGIGNAGMAPAGPTASGTESSPAPTPGGGNGPSLDGMTPLPPGGASQTPAPNVPTASTFQGANNARAAEANRYLQEGDNLWRQNSRDEALARWNQAVQAGVGSPAALVAQDRLNKEAAGEPPL
jgi:hypothetical protein